MNWIETIGLLASILVATSLLMSSIVKLRWFNTIGAIAFVAYGVLISSLSVALVNGFIIVINIYYLVKMSRQSDFFKILEESAHSEFLKEFFRLHKTDMQKFSAIDFSKNLEHYQIFFILRNHTPAAVMLAKKADSETLKVEADYAIREFRDFKIGQFVYNQSDFFKEKGYKKIQIEQHDHSQKSYFSKVGFRKISDTIWEKNIE